MTTPFRMAATAALCSLLLFAPCGHSAQSAQTSKPAPATDEGWPRTYQSGNLEFTVYQPQLDAWDGNRLDFHMAVSAGEKGSQSPAFGVVWMTARADVDKTRRLVYLDSMKIPRVNFPSASDGGAAYQKTLETFLPKKSKAIALDRIEADLAILAAENKGATVPIKNDPPRILFSREPAILLFVDGDPVFKPVEKTTWQRLINTRPLVLRDSGGRLYIHLFDGWLSSASISGAWTVVSRPPKELDTIAQQLAPTNIVDLLEGAPSNPDDPKTKPSLKKGPVPKIITSNVPSELIVTEGEPNFVPIDGTQLLYVSNTTGNIFKSMADQNTYILVTGRWFRAASWEGPWAFVAGNALPVDFASIPDTSAKENVKASVPGTRQAQEALIANSVPQTAKIERKSAKTTPVYDGEPQLRTIEGTPLQYVVNSGTPVIMVDAKTWYAVEKGVWFVATSPKGPWTLAVSVPAVIYTIPASSPLHYVTYVKVYDSTPEVVYVGYTPGYMGTVVTSDYVVVYGTGYTYTPWIGAYYYPPPPTYGFGVVVRYTPWTGWAVAFGFGWSYGPTTVMAWGCYPSWGAYYYPPYYRPPYSGAVVTPYGAAVWGPGGWARTTGNVYSHYGTTSTVRRTSGGYNAYTGNRWGSQVGQSYNSATGQLSAGQRAAVGNAYTGDYAAGRRGYTTNVNTGATAAGRQTVSGNVNTGNYRADSVGGGYNPQTGRYAAGEKTTIGNTKTGQSVTAGQGTAGNARTGQNVDYRYVHGESGAGAGQIGDSTIAKTASGDYYATRDGNVYKKEGGGGWSQYQPGGSTGGGAAPYSRGEGSGRWSQLPDGSPTTNSLNESARAREMGQQKWSGYQSSPAASSWSGRTGGSGGGRRR